MSTPTHCPGFEALRDLESLICKCNNCGAEVEIFSDEFNREHTCNQCKQKIDFKQCEYNAKGADKTHR